jgi:hypothetical protein
MNQIPELEGTEMVKGTPIKVTFEGEGVELIATFVKISGTGFRVVRLSNEKEIALDPLDKMERVVL